MVHDESGARLLGFDNAHPIREGSGPGGRTRIQYDHRHTGERTRFYHYAHAAQWSGGGVNIHNTSCTSFYFRTGMGRFSR
jgi:hypothetical protein